LKTGQIHTIHRGTCYRQKKYGLFLVAALLGGILYACAAKTPGSITIIEGENYQTIESAARTPLAILTDAGLSLTPEDRLLVDGLPHPPDQPIAGSNLHTLQILRAAPVTITTPEGTQVFLTSAETVAEALREAGIQLFATDFLDPPANTPVNKALNISYRPARPMVISTAGSDIQVRTAAQTVGAALADSGVALQGLDYSLPSETQPLPVDGRVRVVRVHENLKLAQKSIPFTSEFVASADVELDQQQILQPGIAGLSVNRVRIRFEDGQEVSRQSESEAVVRPPQNRVVGFGTQVKVKTADLGGVQVEYWRALNLFATSYSPCRSAADRCYSGTSSGKPVAKGVVAVKYSWYLQMQGQPVYIPGYGFATIEDVGGGIPGTPWIDLGYSDNDWVEWGDWVTVYFLTPVPASVPYTLD
jgi:resuscitation-promoting factor RpfB